MFLSSLHHRIIIFSIIWIVHFVEDGETRQHLHHQYGGKPLIEEVVIYPWVGPLYQSNYHPSSFRDLYGTRPSEERNRWLWTRLMNSFRKGNVFRPSAPPTTPNGMGTGTELANNLIAAMGVEGIKQFAKLVTSLIQPGPPGPPGPQVSCNFPTLGTNNGEKGDKGEWLQIPQIPPDFSHWLKGEKGDRGDCSCQEIIPTVSPTTTECPTTDSSSTTEIPPSTPTETIDPTTEGLTTSETEETTTTNESTTDEFITTDATWATSTEQTLSTDEMTDGLSTTTEGWTGTTTTPLGTTFPTEESTTTTDGLTTDETSTDEITEPSTLSPTTEGQITTGESTIMTTQEKTTITESTNAPTSTTSESTDTQTESATTTEITTETSTTTTPALTTTTTPTRKTTTKPITEPVVVDCGETIVYENATWLSSNLFDPESEPSICVLTVRLNSSDRVDVKEEPICQIRLDFKQFSIAQPNRQGNCLTDNFRIFNAENRIPTICGDNPDQHMYLKPKSRAKEVGLVFKFGQSPGRRFWKIHVTLVPCCANHLMAPADCLQYFNDYRGIVKSFNWIDSPSVYKASNHPRQLSNQHYNICFEADSVAKTICYTPCQSAELAFSISENALRGPFRAGVGVTNCSDDFLLIANGYDKFNKNQRNDRFCGTIFNPNGNVTVNQAYQIAEASTTICSDIKPFQLHYTTNMNELPVDVANNGFCLQYKQDLNKNQPQQFLDEKTFYSELEYN